MIAVLVPVLERPANASKLFESVQAATTVEHQLVFIASAGDDDQIHACQETGATVIVAGWMPDAGDYARKINLGFRFTRQPFVFQGADDLDFQPGWDVAVLLAAEDGAGVVGTNDQANPLVKRGHHSTHSLIRRVYIDELGGTFDEQPGVVLHEDYDHQAVENELLAVAKARSLYAHAADAVVAHRHPIFDRSVARDATYEKGLANGREDMALFRARHKAWLTSRVPA